VVAAVAAVVTALAMAACGGPATGTASGAGTPSGPAASSALPPNTICGGDGIFIVLLTRYDGHLPYCRGFTGDAAHAGEGRAGIDNAEGPTSTAVEQYMLSNARAIYTFKPTGAWLAQHPHPRDVEGFFIRQTTPRPGGTEPRAYKDFLTPPAGQAGHEKEFALVAVIVSPTSRPDPVRKVTSGGIWFVGCLDRPKPDKHEYLDPCPAWVWTGTAVTSTTQRL
jgi:hypothetical protein